MPCRAYCKCVEGDGLDPCNLDLVRRTVWDGSRELWEIQMPGGEGAAELENDTEPVRRAAMIHGLDPNPFFGRVAYTYGRGIDRPLGVTRINYVDLEDGAHKVWDPFTIVPLWNSRGQPDLGYFAGSGATHCVGTGRCVRINWPLAYEVYGNPTRLTFFFHGTLTEKKRNKTGTLYRRNRYYDPRTGRFTQEDPIGLAGGLNLYGFAGGDPVNLSDPFGLMPCEDEPIEECEELKVGIMPAWIGGPGKGLIKGLPLLGRFAQTFWRTKSLSSAVGAFRTARAVGKLVRGSRTLSKSGKLLQLQKSGGLSAANELFEALPRVGGINVVKTSKGVVRTIKFPGGGSASVRAFSSGRSLPTLQISLPWREAIKIRFPGVY